MRCAPSLLALAGVLLPAWLLAQEPQPSPSPSPETKVSEPKDKKDRGERTDRGRRRGRRGRERGEEEEGDEDSSLCTVEEPCLRADRKELEPGKGHYRASGFVDLQFGDSRIQADAIDMYETTRPDGTRHRRIVGVGNVVFLRGDERLAGERMEMDLHTGKGHFEEALGFVQPGVFIEGKKIERLDAETYRIEGGKFTSCSQPTPRWSFTASSAKMQVDDKITAHNVVFRVKNVPTFYVPYFTYPIEEDQRSTGFLMPHFGHSSDRGFNIGGGFFWAMGRSFDQTFYADNYSQFGYGLGHEFRYALKDPSRGTFRSYGFRRKTGGWEYDLNWNAVQMLPGKIRAAVRVQESSTLDFQERFQDSLDLASRRTRFSTVSLQRAFGATTVELLYDSNDTFFAEDDAFDRRRRMPTFRVSQSQQKILGSPLVLGYEARAENVAFGNQDLVNSYGRYDVNPRLSLPVSVPWLTVTPEAQVRYTAYGVSDVGEGSAVDLSGPPLRRKYFEASVDMRGPTFSRVFNTPGNFYSERFKHVIGPEVTWTYRTKVDNFDSIPWFDGNDRIPATNELNYALVQRFYSKRGRGGGEGRKTEPYEFLNWRIAQTYYVEVAASLFDPNYASSAFGPEGVPAHFSPIQSRLRFRPLPQVSANFDLEYDVNFRQLRNMSLSSTVGSDRFRLQASWFRAKQMTIIPGQRAVDRDTIRGVSRIELFPGKFALEGSAYYDLLKSRLRQATASVRYDVQCCGFVAEMIQSDYNAKQDRQFRFSIELANLGSIGNFGNQDPTSPRGQRGMW